MRTDILVVDDEAEVRAAIAGILEDEGYKPRLAANSDEALAAVQRRMPGLVLLDIWLEGSRKDGMALLDDLKVVDATLPIVMISGHGTIETAVAAIKKGAYDFLEKPFQADRLLVLIGRALEAARLRRENAELAKRAGGPWDLIGRSAVIQHVRTIIQRAAPSNSRLLIVGPPGSGKEVIARQVHARSRRADGPFVVVPCATLTPERMDIELFGAESGFPMPEMPRRLGLFEQADGGTLLLDEIADLPLETQAKILRVLQDQGFTRPGGNNRVDVDVRVIAASAKDLNAEMAAGRVRSDLYYRLNVVPVPVAGLGERRQDIPLLVDYFMERGAQAAGLPPRRIADDTMTLLQAAEWPGNVRQLRNVIEWMLIMAPGETAQPIGIDGLPPEFAQQTTAALNPNGNGELMTLGLREARVHFERRYLQAQLDRFGGNISRTASFVGMERSALHRKLKSLNIHGGAD